MWYECPRFRNCVWPARYASCTLELSNAKSPVPSDEPHAPQGPSMHAGWQFMEMNTPVIMVHRCRAAPEHTA